MATPCYSSPPWPPSSSSTRSRSNSSSFLPHTATSTTTTQPAASSKNAPHRLRALPEPETALVAAGVAAAVGIAAAVLLRGDGKEQPTDSEQDEKKAVEEEACGACGGTGLCPRCKGEGFVFKEVGEEAAGRARRAAKNMATRYTAGLPTKWTYCNKCSSTRSCAACDGTGTVVVVSSKSKAATTK